MRSQRTRSAGVVGAVCLAGLLLSLPAAAGAASKYPPDAAARGFEGGLAGWTPSASTGGTCLAPLLCASVDNSFQGSGGADGGGFIRSAYTGVVGVMAVGGTATAVWQSPSFSYAGVGGSTPGALSFSVDRRADVDQLLAVSGNSAEYSVQLVDLSAGGEITPLIAPTTLAGAGSWTNVRRAVDPGLLTTGDDYRIRITSSYTSGTSVLVTGNADFDNVVLAAAGTGNGKGDGKGNGGKGNDGKGRGGLSADRLEALLREATPGAATLRGKRLLVRVSCPRKAGRACRTTAQGLLRRGRPATAKRTVRLRSGKSKLVTLPIKPKVRGRLEKRKRLLVRQKVRAGKVTATVYKTRRLIRND